ncbi:hypothetical protein [Nocardia australiensis]|uniref:hypothetical protein n=1 Tax=Nocardia australiensis TaxID=2887191 RepID=UPI001D135169|nr:hypothetical protein [Nocardia australiensis]
MGDQLDIDSHHEVLAAANKVLHGHDDRHRQIAEAVRNLVVSSAPGSELDRRLKDKLDWVLHAFAEALTVSGAGAQSTFEQVLTALNAYFDADIAGGASVRRTEV